MLNDRVNLSEENIYKIFGNEAAENETLDRLKEYYFKSRTYEQIVGNLPLRILVGHKGIGKSALFKIAYSEDPDRGHLPVWIKPDDIATIRSESSDFLTLIKDWKAGLIDIIGHKVIQSFGLEEDEGLRAKISQYAGQAVSVLIKTIKQITATVSLDSAKELLLSNLLSKRVITVYLDDLDRGWEGRPQDIKRISALLNAVRDLSSENEGIQFRIALRSDVYFLYRTSDESTDKIEGSVIWYSWVNHDILILLAKRIETFFGRELNDDILFNLSQSKIASFLDPVMSETFFGSGKWEAIPTYRMLMSLIRKRPRDLVKLCTLAARKAYQTRSPIIATQHFEAIFEEYSQGRIQDTINEYKSELRDIERLLMNMKPSTKEKMTAKAAYLAAMTIQRGSELGGDRQKSKPTGLYMYSTESLLKKLINIQQTGQFKLADGSTAREKHLANFLFKINFLTARKNLPDGQIQRKYFEENRYLSNSFVDFGYAWEVHPAYRWALQPDSFVDVLKDLDLPLDEQM